MGACRLGAYPIRLDRCRTRHHLSHSCTRGGELRMRASSSTLAARSLATLAAAHTFMPRTHFGIHSHECIAFELHRWRLSSCHYRFCRCRCRCVF